MSRLERNPAAIGEQVFDVAIVGGGITGAGVARHAALAGLSTLLIEAADFASGTSSRSTKLIHGGLRYLAMGDIGLVREGALERKSLKVMAPHLTQPQWMVVPAQSRAAMLKLRTGISLYEKLGAVETADRHQNWNSAAIASHEPLLDQHRFPFACAYREYLTDDARLVMATLRSAAIAGAVICNYAKLSSFSEQATEGLLLEIDDLLGGDRYSARARVLVNAAGPWVESVQAAYQGQRELKGESLPRLHLSKGVHVALPREQLPINNMVMMTASDNRPVFAIPRGQVTYVGTTDTSVIGGPGYWPEVTYEDVAYLLEGVNRHFDCDDLGVGDVVGSWAGLRPLIHQPGKSPKEMSRKDEIWRSLPRVVSIAGGKLTGYRKMAEQVLGQVGQILERGTDLEDPLAVLPGGDVADVDALVA
ncbi:MAG: FAD-dependent oxidoreductase, partial [Pseudomonadales bacterium]